MNQLAISRFDIPGDPSFPLNSMFQKPKTAKESGLLALVTHFSANFDSFLAFFPSDELRAYLQQARQECGLRLVNRVFDTENGQPSKWWMCFVKRKFMNINLGGHGK